MFDGIDDDGPRKPKKEAKGLTALGVFLAVLGAMLAFVAIFFFLNVGCKVWEKQTATYAEPEPDRPMRQKANPKLPR